VAWTEETLTIVSSGDAFRGLLLARRCNHCHGEEGFSSVPAFPNLAGAGPVVVLETDAGFSIGEACFTGDAGYRRGISGARLGRPGCVLRDAAYGK
jgi:hypothetical protein